MLESRPATLTYEDYLNTPDDERWELLRGALTRRPTPNTAHQRTLGNLAIALFNFVDDKGLGEVIISPLDVVLSFTNVLEPDLMFVSTEQQTIITEANIQGAPALVVEVISPSTANKDRDLKRAIYAEHGVREYWLVDPDARTVSVLALHGKEFREVGRYSSADTLSSPALAGLALDLTSIFPLPNLQLAGPQILPNLAQGRPTHGELSFVLRVLGRRTKDDSKPGVNRNG